MIKKIHFIWLGSQLPKKNSEIIEEWRALMPDFEICNWGDQNIRKYECLFLRQCLRNKQYAFAADYLRVKIIHENGGFYLDTDMKLIKPLNDILVGKFMIGLENDGIPGWAIFYSEVNGRLLSEGIQNYESLYFDRYNPPIITAFLKDLVFKHQEVVLHPSFVFYPMPFGTDVSLWNEYILEETYGVHLWDFSWNNNHSKKSSLWHSISIFFHLVVDFFYFEYPMSYFLLNIKRSIKILQRL